MRIHTKHQLPPIASKCTHISVDVLALNTKQEVCVGYYNYFTKEWCFDDSRYNFKGNDDFVWIYIPITKMMRALNKKELQCQE